MTHNWKPLKCFYDLHLRIPPSSPWSKGRTADVLYILNLEKNKYCMFEFLSINLHVIPISSALLCCGVPGRVRFAQEKCLWKSASNIILILWHWMVLLAAAGLVRSWDQPQEPSFHPGSGLALWPVNGPAKEKWDSGPAKGKSVSALNKHPGPQCASHF